MAKFDLEINETAFDKIGRSPAVTAALQRIAEDAAAAARAAAPVNTGAYRDGIKTRIKASKHRNVARVEFTDPKSVLIESKTGNAYRALRAAKG